MLNFLKKHSKRIIWSLIILVIALLVNIYLIPDRQIPADNLPRVTEGDVTYIVIESADLKQQIQESIDSGNLNEIIWKIIYLGSGRDELCFKKIDESNHAVFVNYSLGKSYEIINTRCLSISKDKNKTTFNLIYNFNLTIPDIPSGQIVNKSDCLPESIEYDVNETCIVGGVNHTCHPCLTSPVTIKYTFPQIQIYFGANLFHKSVKFIFICVLTAILIKELLEVFYFFFYEKRAP